LFTFWLTIYSRQHYTPFRQNIHSRSSHPGQIPNMGSRAAAKFFANQTEAE